MSVNFSTYLGCYIEFPQEKVEVKKYYLESPETKQRFNVNGEVKFCPKTGVELVRVEETLMEHIDPIPYITNEIIGSNGQALQEDVFIRQEGLPGVFMSNNRCYRVSGYDDSSIKDLSDLDIKSEIEKFKEEYKDYLDYYRKEYGDFQVKFGLIGYWS